MDQCKADTNSRVDFMPIKSRVFKVDHIPRPNSDTSSSLNQHCTKKRGRPKKDPCWMEVRKVSRGTQTWAEQNYVWMPVQLVTEVMERRREEALAQTRGSNSA